MIRLLLKRGDGEPRLIPLSTDEETARKLYAAWTHSLKRDPEGVAVLFRGSLSRATVLAWHGRGLTPNLEVAA